MSQIEKIKAQSSHSFSCVEDALNPENQKFLPFYLSENFFSKKNKLVCDYCGGQDFTGNPQGYYWATLIFENKGIDPKVCCSLKHCEKSPGKMWEYKDQVVGQPKPLEIPKDAPLSWQMIFDRWFVNRTTRFKIMAYNQIDFGLFKKICYPSSHEGGTFKDGWCFYNGENLVYNLDAGCKSTKGSILILSNSDIIKTINEMLAAMRFVQLKLF